MSSNTVRNTQNILSGLCTPAKLYGIISLVSIGGFLYSQDFMKAMGQAMFSAIWIFVLNWICSEGWTGLSWFLVIVPIVFGVFVFMAGASLAIAEIAQAEARMAHRNQ
jgi:hypothetical protein